MSGHLDPTALFERRFLFVTGKGGVGRTTVCASLGSALAASGRRVLIAVTSAEERVASLFDHPPLDHHPTQLGPNLWGIHLEPHTAIRTYGAMVLRSRSLYTRLFDNKYVRGFFDAVPGLNAWAILGHAWYLAVETEPEGHPPFDTVILDAPATGHGLEMLGVPKVIIDVAPAGALRRDAEAAWAMFSDREQSGVVVVTLPEELPVVEAKELTGVLGELGLPVAALVANCVLGPLFSEEECRALLSQPLVDPKTPAEGVLDAALRRALREDVQRRALERLGALGLPLVQLPFLYEPPAAPEEMAQLSRVFMASTGP